MASDDLRKDEPELPCVLESLFWDCDFRALSLQTNLSFIIRRILDRGNWDEITWLRRTVGDPAIRDWLLRKGGGDLDPRRLRFWGVILDLPEAEVDGWVHSARQSTWHGRHVA